MLQSLTMVVVLFMSITACDDDRDSDDDEDKEEGDDGTVLRRSLTKCLLFHSILRLHDSQVLERVIGSPFWPRSTKHPLFLAHLVKEDSPYCLTLKTILHFDWFRKIAWSVVWTMTIWQTIKYLGDLFYLAVSQILQLRRRQCVSGNQEETL